MTLIAAGALVSGPPPSAEAWAISEELRKRSDLSLAQLELMAHDGVRHDVIPYSLAQSTACEGGEADIFPCRNVDLLAHIPTSELGGTRGNDIWGWFDRQSGREYALVGRKNGTAFVDVTDPESPIYVGNLPTHSQNSPWRDIKVYDDHAFIVAESAGHGMQVFDLTELRGVSNPPVEFEETGHYDEFESAHNIAINEETGFAYAVGSETCDGGLHMIDVREPRSPTFAGCFSKDGATHDAQCVTYRGPDRRYRGREICFSSNEDTITLVDVTDKGNPEMISSTGYDNIGFTHQGWLTEDQAYFLLDDELDERRFGFNTRTFVWDMGDLEKPRISGIFTSDRPSADHNQYVRGDYTFQANYRSGLRILRIVDPAAGKLEEVAWFDTYPESDNNVLSGLWGVYPFLQSGAVIVNDIHRGLFILRPRLADSGIFSDDFESGELLPWTSSQGNVRIVQPGLKGSDFALEVDVDGSDQRSFVTSQHPAREASLDISFLIAPGDADLGGQQAVILRLLGAGETVAVLTLEERGRGYRVLLSAHSGGELKEIGSARLPAGRATRVRLVWQRASGTETADGVARLFRKKKRTAESITLDNGRLVVDAVELGLPQGSAPGSSGRLLFDRYTSVR